LRNLIDEYEANISRYEKLASKVCGILEDRLKEEKVNFLSINSRVKSKQSISGKFDKKSYSKIEELTDMVGIRIISYTESEIPKIEKILRECFHIHEEDCVNKSASMAINEVGYKSVHYVCDIGNDRAKISEYKQFTDVRFEIQLRTILQHAWAEIEHDRNYKFSGELPKHLKRRFFLLAGTLELLDREFENLSQDIDIYAKEQQEKIDRNELDIDIDTINVNEYIEKKFSNMVEANTTKKVIDEMRDFGLVTLGDVNKLIDSEYILHLSQYYGGIKEYVKNTKITSMGLLRDVLMLSDINKYFNQCSIGWSGTDYDSVDMLGKKYGNDTVEAIFSQYDIHIIPNFDN
jgi:putative GTP pyrophosphokinase